MPAHHVITNLHQDQHDKRPLSSPLPMNRIEPPHPRMPNAVVTAFFLAVFFRLHHSDPCMVCPAVFHLEFMI
jgi:hypothetical protein